MFVFAIAILIIQDARRRVRLIASLAQRKTYVTKVSRDVIVQRLNFLFVSGPSTDQSLGFGFDLLVGNDPIALQVSVPLSHFIPTLKRSQLNMRRRFGGFFLPCGFVLFLFCLGLEVCVSPDVDAPVVLFFHRRRIEAGVSF